MTNNIVVWKVKKIEYLTVPVDGIKDIIEKIPSSFDRSRFEWICDNEEITRNGRDFMVHYTLGEESEMRGKIKGDVIEVETMKIAGDSSGDVFDEIILPLLMQSQGYFEVAFIREDGEITRLHVNDGEVEEIEIEL